MLNQPIDVNLLAALLGQNAQTTPIAPTAPSIGPTMQNAAMLGQGPTQATAQASGSSGNTGNQPKAQAKDKTGGMWDAMITALSAGMAGIQKKPYSGQYPYAMNVGGGQGTFVSPLNYYKPGQDFHSLLASYLRRG